MKSHNCSTRFVTILLFIFLLAGPMGGDVALADNHSADALRPGSWSLQFGVSDLDIESFGGVSLSCKRHYSDKSALRLGITLDARLYDIDDDYTYYNDEYKEPRRIDNDGRGVSLKLTALYIYYPATQRKVKLFVGVGPVFGYTNDRYDQRISRDYYGKDLYSVIWENNVEWSTGGGFVLGGEWFAGSSISFHIEYSATMRFLYSHKTYTDDGRQRKGGEIVRQFRLDARTVNFGISLYL